MNSTQSPASSGHLLAAIFLVAGTCIGGGMLALPIATGLGGFWPSLILMAVCWAAMTCTGLMLVEVSLWMEEGVHVLSMVSRLLSPIWKWITWGLYLFVCYASLVAYTAGGGVQIASGLTQIGVDGIGHEIGCVIFVAALGMVIYFGNETVGRVNSILFIAMILAYLALISMGLDEIKPQLLSYKEWKYSWMSLPFLLTAFSFQTMVPSLSPYLKRNPGDLKKAIIFGTLLAFVVYAVWQWLVLGIVPVEGPNGLVEALARGEPASQFIREHVEGTWVGAAAEYFAFFAISTSFLGIALGLFDFLADGFSIPEKGIGKWILAFLIIVPTLFFAINFERAFIIALDASGGYGDAILNGLIPVMMVWIGRYQRELSNGYRFIGGKALLCIVFVFFAAILVHKILSFFEVFPSIYTVYYEVHQTESI